MLLKSGDKVYIDSTREEGTVKEVHPHGILVRVKVPGGHEDRREATTLPVLSMYVQKV
jgi:hypothetical protein